MDGQRHAYEYVLVSKAATTRVIVGRFAASSSKQAPLSIMITLRTVKLFQNTRPNFDRQNFWHARAGHAHDSFEDFNFAARCSIALAWKLARLHHGSKGAQATSDAAYIGRRLE